MSARVEPLAPVYRMVPPAPPLRPFVECLWMHVIPAPAAGDDARILPDGRIDLVWIRGLGVGIAGPQSRFTLRPATSPLLAFGARFHPGAAPALLRLPARLLLDGHVPLDRVDPRLAARLDDRLGAARGEREAYAALDAELVRRLERLPEPDGTVRTAVALLDEPASTVAGVASRVFLSERQLQRRFAEHVGYGPKTLHRVLRLQRAVAALGARRETLAGAALAAGYADQAHLARESRQLAGLSPAELAAWVAPRAGSPPAA